MADSVSVIEPAIEQRTSNTVQEQDESRLARFGYQQELKRDWVSSSLPSLTLELRVGSPYMHWLTSVISRGWHTILASLSLSS